MKDDLIERLEAATGPDRGLDAAIACVAKAGLPSGCDWAFKFPNWGPDGRSGRVNILGNVNGNGDYIAGHFNAPAFTASTDEALKLVPKGYCWHEIKGPHRYLNIPTPVPNYWSCYLDTFNHEKGVKAWGTTPALAIVIAALRAQP